MPDPDSTNNPTRPTPETEGSGDRRKWKPIFDEYPRSHPVAWICPCGALVWGSLSCNKCGRVPRDHVAQPKPEHIRMRQWRKFGRRC